VKSTYATRVEDLLISVAVEEAKKKPLQPIAKTCDRWAVMTTIFPPSQAALDIIGMQDWCLVVVGDKKSVPYAINGQADCELNTLYI
jgi:hypothetical protein